MEVVLNSLDLGKLDEIIKKMPFEHAFPIFQFLRGKVEECIAAKVKEAEQAKVPEMEIVKS